MKRWTTEMVEYLIQNYEEKSFSEISNILNKSESAIRAKCHDLNLVKKDRWTEADLFYLSENYSSLSTKDIAKKLNRTESAVQIKAKKLGLKKYSYTCNHDFFESIQTEEQAYWLGFISADGWISISDTGSGVLGIELQRGDIEHLKKFNKCIQGNYKIDTFEKTCSLSSKESRNKMCRIRIYSKKMVNDLINLGITSHKTYDMPYPKIDANLLPHYIRGYFDGDGCVRLRTYTTSQGEVVKYPICDITSHDKIFLEHLREDIYNKKQICSYIYPDKTNYRLYTHAREHSLSFLKYLYHNASIYLDRKFKIYQEIIEYEQTRNCLAS